MNLPSALVFSTQPPVSVYGTGTCVLALEVFLGNRITPTIASPSGSAYFQVRMVIALNLYLTYSLKRTIPSVRVAFTLSSPHRLHR